MSDWQRFEAEVSQWEQYHEEYDRWLYERDQEQDEIDYYQWVEWNEEQKSKGETTEC